MLIRELVSSRRFIALAVLGAGVATGAMVSPTPTTAGVPVVSVGEPEAPLVIAASLVAPEAPPPARPPAPDCGNVAAIGDAIDTPMRDSEDSNQIEVLGASVEGCTIAAWTSKLLVVSWDAGRHFTRIAFEQPEDEWHRHTIVATADRVVVVKDEALGVIRRGRTAITWRALAPAFFAAGDADRPYLELAAAGRWTAIKNDDEHLVGITDDDGATWRYLTLPRAQVLTRDVRITDTGELWVDEMTYREAKIPAGESLSVIHHRRADGARWVADDAGAHRSSSWIYETTLEDDWGCGSSQRIVAIRGGEHVVVARDVEALRGNVTVAYNARGAYSQYGDAIYRIEGARATKLIDALNNDPRVAGVDASGALIAAISGRVVRWSARGGWRILWDADRDAGPRD